MTQAEYREVEKAANAARTTVSEWVRQALRKARRPSGVPQPARETRGGPATVRETSPAYGDLLARVMEAYDLPNEEAAVRFALRQAADRPMERDELLAMEGSGWEGELSELRAADEPEVLP